METVWEKDLSGDRVGGLSGDSLGRGGGGRGAEGERGGGGGGGAGFLRCY